MSNETVLPTDLDGWKQYFREHIDEARCAAMSDDDRDELVAHLKQEVELIFFGPLPAPPQHNTDHYRDDPWGDIGYQQVT